MVCKKCGSDNDMSAKFCSKCGNSLVANEYNLYSSDGSNMINNYSSNSKTRNWIAIIACICLAVSTILPFASALGMSKSLMDGGDGVFVIGLALLTLAAAVKNKNVCVIICGVFGILLFGLESSTIVDATKDNSWAALLIKKDMGYYLMIISSVAIIVGGVIGLKNRK